METDVLGGEDTAWLRLDAPKSPMVVNAMLELAGPLPEETHDALLRRIAELPPFHSRVIDPGLRLGRAFRVRVPDFDPHKHVERVTLESGTEAALASFVSDAVSRPLDLERPPWRSYAIERPGHGTTILFRVHHCVADGFALLELLASLADKRPEIPGGPARPLPASERPVRSAARSLKRIVGLPPDPATTLKRRLGPRKRVAWTPPLSLSDVKTAARATSSTVNDVLVSVVSGALRRTFERHDPEVPLEIHAMVPVDLRRGSTPTALDNRFGLVILGLPVGIGDPIARVGAVRQRMNMLKNSPEPFVTQTLLRALGFAPRPVEGLAASFFGKKASLVLTNVPGPTARLSIAGIPIVRLAFWVPPAAGMGLGISILSYAGEVTIGVLADETFVDAGALAADVRDELACLLTTLRAREERARPKPVELWESF